MKKKAIAVDDAVRQFPRARPSWWAASRAWERNSG